MVKAVSDISSLGTIFGIWAHPDDEVFSMAGIMAVASLNGQQVICATATRGEAGLQDEQRWPKSRLAEVRTLELGRAYKILGVKSHYWLDYPDGGCDEVEDMEAAGRIAKLIKKYQPNSIFTFDSTGFTGHPDHIAVSRWSVLARDLAGSRADIFHTALTPKQYEAYKRAGVEKDFFYNIDKPTICSLEKCDYCLELDKSTQRLKLEALQAMPSQTAGVMQLLKSDLMPALSVEAFTRI